jgi:hypothetical protein
MESTTKERSIAADPIVGVACVHRAQSLHCFGQPAVRAVHEQMEVVVQQAISKYLDLEHFTDLAEESTKFDSINVAEEDRLPIDTPVGDVMKTVGWIEA